MAVARRLVHAQRLRVVARRNNVFVSATNLGFDPIANLDGIPADRVRQIHLAGHSQGRELLIDTHDQPVPTSVWNQFVHVMPRLGPVATMIDAMTIFPPLAELLDELAVARRIGGQAMLAAHEPARDAAQHACLVPATTKARRRG
jgi:uncharacterized protein (UPF0276 family)